MSSHLFYGSSIDQVRERLLFHQHISEDLL